MKFTEQELSYLQTLVQDDHSNGSVLVGSVKFREDLIKKLVPAKLQNTGMFEFGMEKNADTFIKHWNSNHPENPVVKKQERYHGDYGDYYVVYVNNIATDEIEDYLKKNNLPYGF